MTDVTPKGARSGGESHRATIFHAGEEADA